MNPTNQPVSFYGDNSRNTDSALLAALAVKDSYAPALDAATNNGVGCARAEIGDTKMVVKDAAANIRYENAKSEAEIRREVAKAEADIRAEVLREGQENMAATKSAECETLKKLGDVECKVIKENSDQTLYLTNQLSVIREQGIRNEYETKLSREQVIKELGLKIDHKAERAEDKLNALKEFEAEKFCALSSRLDKDFFALSSQVAKCCCEDEVRGVQQTGILNSILNILSVGGPGLK